MQLTFDEIKEKENIILSLLLPAELEQNGQSTLKYAYQKWKKNVDKPMVKLRQDYQDRADSALTDLKIELCVKNDKGIVQYSYDDKGNVKGYQFTKEKEKEFIHKSREITKKLNDEIGKEIIEFEPFLFTDENRIAGFDLFAQEELKGIFLP